MKRILIAGDQYDLVVIDSLFRSLREGGYEIEMTNLAEVIIERMIAGDVDLVITLGSMQTRVLEQSEISEFGEFYLGLAAVNTARESGSKVPAIFLRGGTPKEVTIASGVEVMWLPVLPSELLATAQKLLA